LLPPAIAFRRSVDPGEGGDSLGGEEWQGGREGERESGTEMAGERGGEREIDR